MITYLQYFTDNETRTSAQYIYHTKFLEPEIIGIQYSYSIITHADTLTEYLVLSCRWSL
jgi:hypothetical protein